MENYYGSRSVDIRQVSDGRVVRFCELPLSSGVVEALRKSGFEFPTEIQLRALPLALFGNDLIVQAKSGTGKTLVFAVAALESCCGGGSGGGSGVKVLVVAPTREIAVQSQQVTQTLADDDKTVGLCIGGLPLALDQQQLQSGCDIVIGTPGRIKSLIELAVLPTEMIRLFILDEVDKLLSTGFYEDIETIANHLPTRKQILVLSATFSHQELIKVKKIMRNPQFVRTFGDRNSTVKLADFDINDDETTPEMWLHGIRQFYCALPDIKDGIPSNKTEKMKRKVVKLTELLSNISFSQCIVFCNNKDRAEALSFALGEQGWLSVCITGSQSQENRLLAMSEFKDYRVHVIVSTDLIARGIDLQHVNLVINMDLPRDPPTYLHRVGRAGRFGGFGIAISLIYDRDINLMKDLSLLFKMPIEMLPNPLPSELELGEKNISEVNSSAEHNLAGKYCSASNRINVKASTTTVVEEKENNDAIIELKAKKSQNSNESAESTYLDQYNHEELCYRNWIKGRT